MNPATLRHCMTFSILANVNLIADPMRLAAVLIGEGFRANEIHAHLFPILETIREANERISPACEP